MTTKAQFKARWALAPILFPVLFLVLVLPLVLPGAPASAAGPGIAIELNKAEDTADSACLAAFVLRNDMASPLDRFSLDLFVFDSEGIIVRQLVLDLAPLRMEKTTVVRFPLLAQPCATIGRVLVNDIPSCRSADTGEDLDCLSVLEVTSRDRIGLTK